MSLSPYIKCHFNTSAFGITRALMFDPILFYMYISLSKLGYMTMIETKCPETLDRVKNQTPFVFTDSRFLTGCRKMGGRQSRGFSFSHCIQLAPEHVKEPQEQGLTSLAPS